MNRKQCLDDASSDSTDYDSVQLLVSVVVMLFAGLFRTTILSKRDSNTQSFWIFKAVASRITIFGMTSVSKITCDTLFYHYFYSNTISVMILNCRPWSELAGSCCSFSAIARSQNHQFTNYLPLAVQSASICLHTYIAVHAVSEKKKKSAELVNRIACQLNLSDIIGFLFLGR